MISYELAKKLKDARFPQEGEYVWCRFWRQPENENYWMRYSRENQNSYDALEIISAPTLSELIETCGDSYFLLRFLPGVKKWWAGHSEQDNHFGFKGSTPEEAVANLWLKLQNGKVQKMQGM